MKTSMANNSISRPPYLTLTMPKSSRHCVNRSTPKLRRKKGRIDNINPNKSTQTNQPKRINPNESTQTSQHKRINPNESTQTNQPKWVIPQSIQTNQSKRIKSCLLAMRGEDRVRVNADRSIIVSTPDVYLPTVNFDIPHLEYLFTLQGCMRITNIQGKDLTFCAFYIIWY